MPPRKSRARVIPIHAPKPAPIHPFDRLHATDTGGLIPGPTLGTGHANDPHITAYYAIAPSILDGMVDLWLQTPPPYDIDRYTFLDVGAGKGRAALLASRYPFFRVEGIELNHALVQIALANAEIWQRSPHAAQLAPLTLHHADALRHPLPSKPTLAFLFHPFELPILRRFLRHVETSLARNPRPFDLVYVNAEHGSLLDRHPAFHRLWTGSVPMSPADHVADLAAIAEQEEYGSTGDELCAFYRFIPTPSKKSQEIQKSQRI
jgi:SAM-dependent methyltransferase